MQKNSRKTVDASESIKDASTIINKIKQIDKHLYLRRAEFRLNNYNKDKVHHKQIAFHKAGKKVRFVFGGNRSGKTECGAVETIWRARGIHPYLPNKAGVTGWVVSLSYEVQRDVAQKKILSYLPPSWIVSIGMVSGSRASPENGIIDYVTIRNVFGTTSTISFKSCEAGREKFQGASLDYVWFDEEPPEDIYDECVMRVLDRSGDIYCTMTPLKGLTWVHDRIYLSQSEDIWYISMEWADNPYLDPRDVERLTKSMSQADLDSRRYGRFRSEHGLVYPEFDPAIHVIDPFDVPKDWYDNISIDPGLNNPLSCHFYAVDYDSNIYVIAEHYEAGRDIDYHAKAIKDIARSLEWPTDKEGRISALIDSAAEQTTLSSPKSVANLFFDRGIVVNTRVDKDVWSGIARVRGLFTDPPKIFIFRSCVNMIRELKSYRYGKGDRPVKVDDHALDELRYYVASRPEPPKIEEQLSVIGKDKNRLIRQVRRYGGKKWKT
ncbi:MAG: terminase family protein [Clostridia bacterium]|nr:terminase family protein [Clostridia bacterium]